jgi:hypothetical protein
MDVIVGIVVACALFVTLAGAVFTDIKLFGFTREQWRTTPPQLRREVTRIFAIIIPATWGYLAFLFVIAPFGQRATVSDLVLGRPVPDPRTARDGRRWCTCVPPRSSSSKP